MSSREKKGYDPDVTVETVVGEALEKRTQDKTLNCADAFAASKETGLSPRQIGAAADLMGLRLERCQMGLFGFPGKKIVKPAKTVDPGLEKEIREAMVNDRLSCVSAWEIADRRGLARMDVASACEALDVRIKPCQLGAF
ncbi:MAG: hypothetical protein KKA60_09415 [Proteobacteria bacterium]|nr:hypothetical protein [Pseudomonadota bacterium]